MRLLGEFIPSPFLCLLLEDEIIMFQLGLS
jgi:hypothetical protein